MRRYRSTKTMKKRLIELIIDRTFRFSDKPAFKLASGKMSSYYFNCKPTTLNSEGMFLVGNLLYDLIKNQKNWKAKAKAVVDFRCAGVNISFEWLAVIVTAAKWEILVENSRRDGKCLWIETFLGSNIIVHQIRTRSIGPQI